MKWLDLNDTELFYQYASLTTSSSFSWMTISASGGIVGSMGDCYLKLLLLTA